MNNKYSLIIIGTGPAGLTASIYASRYKINHIVIGESLGGLAFSAHRICNFPSYEEISGVEITEKMKKHAESLGAIVLQNKVVDVRKNNNEFKVVTQNKEEFFSDTILLANGTEHRKMNLPNEEDYIGRGLSYCATCDAMFYRNKTVAVLGGSDSANTASLYLSDIADKVYQIYRGDKLRGETAWVEKVKNNDKIEVLYNTEITSLEGKDKLEKIILNKKFNGKNEIVVDGLFVEIGTIPQRALIDKLALEVDNSGYIKVGPDQKTNQDGVWASGDITTNSNNFHQIITACGEGAVASEDIFKFLQNKK